MTFLSNLLSSNQPSSNIFFLVQSCTAQSALPVIHGLVESQKKCSIVLVCCLYAPSQLLPQKTLSPGESNKKVNVLDWTADVPGYNDRPINWTCRLEEIESAIKGSSNPVAVVLDSVDTIDEDIESPSKTYKFISSILSFLTSRNDASRLICHITSLSPVLPLLKQPRFSSSLIHLTAHPPALLKHIARAYLIPPPPSSSSRSSSTPSTDSPDALKFWRVFVPLVDNRPLEIEALVFGSDDHAEGGESPDALVVEVLVRGRGADLPVISNLPTAPGKRKGVERLLEGWSVSKGGPVALEELDSLKGVWRKQGVANTQDEPDPTKDLTFNLSLTDAQQASRSQVPLPYEHSGKSSSGQSENARIYYDPDSADDMDDEDPDEDLDL